MLGVVDTRLIRYAGHARRPKFGFPFWLTRFGTLVVQIYLYEQLLDEPSIARPSGETFVVKPEFECPVGQAGASRPSWLGYRSGLMVSFSARPGIVHHTIRCVG